MPPRSPSTSSPPSRWSIARDAVAAADPGRRGGDRSRRLRRRRPLPRDGADDRPDATAPTCSCASPTPRCAPATSPGPSSAASRPTTWRSARTTTTGSIAAAARLRRGGVARSRATAPTAARLLRGVLALADDETTRVRLQAALTRALALAGDSEAAPGARRGRAGVGTRARRPVGAAPGVRRPVVRAVDAADASTGSWRDMREATAGGAVDAATSSGRTTPSSKMLYGEILAGDLDRARATAAAPPPSCADARPATVPRPRLPGARAPRHGRRPLPRRRGARRRGRRADAHAVRRAVRRVRRPAVQHPPRAGSPRRGPPDRRGGGPARPRRRRRGGRRSP